MSPFIAELVGTALLLLMGCGVVADLTLNKTKATGFNWLANTTAWALGVFISVRLQVLIVEHILVQLLQLVWQYKDVSRGRMYFLMWSLKC